MADLNKLLKKHWGFDQLRPLQQQAVDAVFDKKDVVVLLPTGGGKSVCYQLPALALPGLAIVVSPLISLMQDQVEQLGKRKIKAIHISGALPQKEIDRLLSNAAFGDYKLLYLSPERLQTEWILERLQQMPISLIAVDEAHCISQWGFDFRPSYLQVKKLRGILPNVPTMALTATATKNVLTDVKSQLLLNSPIEIRDTFFRTNLALHLIHTERKEARLLSILQKTKGSAIVYLRSRNGTVALSKFLNQNNIAALHYHAGMDAQERAKNQTEWNAGRARIMVATTAFGMGIDKADVRLIIHLDIPDSPESYYQEIGRAGRDGKNANCFLFYNNADQERLASGWKDEPTIAEIRQIYSAFFSDHQIAIGAGEFSERPLNIYPFCAKYKFSSRHVHQAFTLLDRMSYIIYQDVSNRPSAIKFIWEEKDLYKFQIQNPSLEPVTKALLRLYGGITEHRTNISEELVSRKTGLPIVQVIKHIDILAKRGILRYKKRYKGTTITLLTVRLPEKNLTISPEFLKQRIHSKQKRAEAMLTILENDAVCRMNQLVAYFDEKTDNTCGKCDVCRKQQIHTVEERIVQQIAQEELNVNVLISYFPHIASATIKKAVESLLDSNKLILTPKGTLKIATENEE